MLIKMTDMNQDSYVVRGKYKLHYEIGKITETVPGIIGIFCWRVQFPSEIFNFCKFFEVEGIEKIENRLFISGLLTEKDLDCYYKSKDTTYNSIDFGVELYKAVKVIREFSVEELRRIFYDN